MDFEKVVRQRKMIREYIANKQIPEELIMRLIKNAHSAPSAGHTQVQEFIIVKDSITKKKLRRVAVDQEYVELAPVLIKGLEGLSDSNPLWVQKWFKKILVQLVKYPDKR